MSGLGKHFDTFRRIFLMHAKVLLKYLSFQYRKGKICEI